MAKWWMGVALAAVVVGQPNAALAQNPPAGAGQLPEPVPCAPSSLGNFIPGPLPGNMAPPGPSPDISIPACGPGAFSGEDYVQHAECYVHIGALALMRQRMGHEPLVYLDPGAGVDTGIAPTARWEANHVALQFGDVDQRYGWGVSGTIGCAMGSCAIEATGFYIPQQSSTRTIANTGKLDLNFINPPLGFEGDNGMWLQADVVSVREQIQLANGELNVRCINPVLAGIEPIVGVRYLDLRERLNIYTGDDDLTVLDINGNPDPTLQATYRVTSHSHMVLGQLGAELQYPSCQHQLAFVATFKGAWGVNFVDTDRSLVRGDGLVGFDTHTSHTQFSSLYEMGFAIDWYVLERMRIRAGYNLLWIVNVPQAKDQIDFDLSNPNGVHSDHGSIFFHGPQIEFQFCF